MSNNYPKITMKSDESVVLNPRDIVEISVMDSCDNYDHYTKFVESKKSENFNISMLSMRMYGVFERKAFWLNKEFDWVIGYDEGGALILIPLRKK